MMRFVITLLLLIVWSHSDGQTNGIVDIKVKSEIEDTIKNYLKQYPSNTQFSIALTVNDSVHFIGFVLNEDEITKTPNENRIFEIGSITKVFTSSLLAHFVTTKKIDLSDNINQYLSFRLKKNKKIPFVSLANHTSGLPRIPPTLLKDIISHPEDPYKDYDESRLIKYLKKNLKIDKEQKGKYNYSNLGAGLLGYVLREMNEQSYESLLQDIIFNQLGMSESTSKIEKVNNTKLVKGLNKKGKETANWNLNVLVGAGGIFSSARDMSKFMIAQYKNIPVFELTHESTEVINEQMEIGLGWHILKNRGDNNILWHNGGTGGYRSSIVINKNQKVGVLVLSNVSAGHKKAKKIDQLSFQLLSILEKN